MQKTPNLVIVESPAKAKTIEKFLGKEYKVLSSYGHIRDLKKKSFGVDIENDFRPDYEVSEDKESVVRELKKVADNADMVWLASDEDREGEAIAWHLYEVLKREGKPTKRIVFHEITLQAIEKAIQNPRDIDINLVDAQQARRVLDRVVGFELSPLLWKRIKPSLSAGRVQSVAVRLIVDREREIRAFKSVSSYKISADVANGSAHSFSIEAKDTFSHSSEAIDFIKRNVGGHIVVRRIESKPARRTPSAPFTTSTLQQEAARKLGFPVSVTMRVAQKLYEEGHITYMRTDSVNLSSLALNTAAKVIKSQWGEEYYQYRTYKTKSKGAQEAHEAIRPTYIEREAIKGTAQEEKLYDLIRKRTLASQMAEACLERTIVSLESEKTHDLFTAEGEVLTFDGFLRLYNYVSEGDEEETEKTHQLPHLKEGEQLDLTAIVAREHYSHAPARYSEASLVRKMEELGIGRPSTYAPTIQTIQNREYVTRGSELGEKRTHMDYIWEATDGLSQEPRLQKRLERTGSNKGKLIPTDIGEVVNDYLVEYFPKVIDYNFTALIEEQFDLIAEGKLVWTEALKHFYLLFHPLVEQALGSHASTDRGERYLGEDPQTGKPVFVRIGRFGALVQIGKNDEGEEKPQYASLTPGLSLSTITLEQALNLFKLPRILGNFEGSPIKVAIGKFGPYAQHAGAFVSIPKEANPLEISLEEVIQLIQNKREAEQKSLLKQFSEDATLSVRDGRFGPYIKHGGANYKLSKEQKERVATLSYEECLEIIKGQEISPKKKAAKKTSSKKKTTTKK
ncbi:type I DNA topoisomerase [Porphyromonas circumdentaria]|uniref:type I DNA topoisomerase n=1 Tax=Porphyromonas circumdentaria TaxID=29524 RepID=UPI0026DC42A4|nr:type I DNA topoisomerase [Porphyromonas circumdentaria]MDO4722977.1 type I DNA topoisomerase [Porphyromonas circumdentaria]